MHSLMFAAVIPKDRQDYAMFWRAFIDDVDSSLSKLEGIERLAENIWLVDLTVSARPFGVLASAAERLRVDYRILPFDAAPQWLQAGQNL